MGEEIDCDLMAKMCLKLNFEGDVHLMAPGDMFKHNPNVNCECGPYRDFGLELKLGAIGQQLWVHNCIKGNKEFLH